MWRIAVIPPLLIACNIRYEVGDGAVVPPYDDLSFARVEVFSGPWLYEGAVCVIGRCATGLTCVSLNCTAAPLCQRLPSTCEQAFNPVCTCDGRTVVSRCVAEARGLVVSFAGACRRSVGVDAAVGVDASRFDGGFVDPLPTSNRCHSVVCDQGTACCAEPTSSQYGLCQPLPCPTCCAPSR
jgi:hypothetical protein